MDRLFRRHQDEKIEPAYWHGYQDGVSAEREKNSAEWAQFFETAKLKNTISGVPIKSREDFYKWKEQVINYARMTNKFLINFPET